MVVGRLGRKQVAVSNLVQQVGDIGAAMGILRARVEQLDASPASVAPADDGETTS